MKRLKTKADIIDWHQRAMARLLARQVGALPGWPRLSDADYQAYHRSIEFRFRQAKRAFNASLKKQAV